MEIDMMKELYDILSEKPCVRRNWKNIEGRNFEFENVGIVRAGFKTESEAKYAALEAIIDEAKRVLRGDGYNCGGNNVINMAERAGYEAILKAAIDELGYTEEGKKNE